MKFDIEVLQLGKMVITGDNLYDMIQNFTTHNVDLLVREVIQNSLDAASGPDDPIIQFQTGSFCNHVLADTIPSLSESMKSIDRPQKCAFLSVKDINCTGLLGDLDGGIAHERQNSPQNLFNLVYDAMNPRQDEGAGGSWGIGKTVYFRFGSGIVFYYSRIKLGEGNFQSRLVGVLAEKKYPNNVLLKNQQKSSGIAFFGRYKNNNRPSTIPIINESEIAEFLGIFEIQPYSEHETGTTVIIPFINEEELLEDSRWAPDVTKPIWYKDLGSLIKESVKKWYFPRLGNPDYKGKPFVCQVNSDILDPSGFHLIYQELLHMYNQATRHREYSQNGLICKPIKLKGGHVVGTFVWKVFTRNDLKMTEPYNAPSPYERFGSEDIDDQSNPAIVLFTRKPGMIISYEIDRKPWVESGLQIDEGQYLIGIFVLNSDVQIESESLEEYFRLSEKADHMKWDDHSKANFRHISSIKPLNRITRNIRRTLKEYYGPKSVTGETVIPGRLARDLGKLLLPPEHFGRRQGSISNPGPESGGKIQRDKGYSFKIVRVNHMSEGMALEVIIIFGKAVSDLFIDFKVAMPQGSINAQSWEKQGNDFPVILENAICNTLRIENRKNPSENLLLLDFKKEEPLFDNHSLVAITPERTAKGTLGRIYLKNLAKKTHEVSVILRFRVLDPSFEMELHPGVKAGESIE